MVTLRAQGSHRLPSLPDREETKRCRESDSETQRSEAAVRHEVRSITNLGCVLEKKGCKKQKMQSREEIEREGSQDRGA